MATFQWTLIGAVFLAGLAGVSCCDSKELHICLNIYLERDFPLVETLLNGRRTARVILEGTDLQNICNHISSLYDCYWNLLPSCDTIWKYDRFIRVTDVLNATQAHLCQGNKNNLKDLLTRNGCLTSNCPGFDWTMSWRRVLRMQRSPSETCPDLVTYWECLAEGTDPCRRLVEVWLHHWCAMDLTPDEERRHFYKANSVVVPEET